jgi:heme oxygenase (mycobilin-producing)
MVPTVTEPLEVFVAISTFAVANDMSEDVEAAFVARPHLVDGAPGFLGMEVWRGMDESRTFWLVTRWTDRESYEHWHRGHTYRASHAGIPKGLKLERGSAKVHAVRRICR